MAKGNLTLRKDSELKAQASELFKALRLELSTATGIFNGYFLQTGSYMSWSTV